MLLLRPFIGGQKSKRVLTACLKYVFGLGIIFFVSTTALYFIMFIDGTDVKSRSRLMLPNASSGPEQDGDYFRPESLTNSEDVVSSSSEFNSAAATSNSNRNASNGAAKAVTLSSSTAVNASNSVRTTMSMGNTTPNTNNNSDISHLPAILNDISEHLTESEIKELQGGLSKLIEERNTIRCVSYSS